MARIDDLLHQYERQVSLPWDRKLAGVQRVWFVVYDKTDERRLRARLGDFELKTKQAGHGWILHDVSDVFARWMAGHKYRDGYFQTPEHLDSAMGNFRDTTVQGLQAILRQAAVDQDTVVAVQGVACLFGFLRVSDLVNAVEADIRGRLVVFFPGEYDNNNYRLLDARDGWNYQAIPITPYQGASLE
ncbi:MAG TPA: BREX protein BrxB domain-containing protein [Gemmataceae bacterium]|nr:BREX protein BrxB domain-containing protein [Gemmataceae bacterium]